MARGYGTGITRTDFGWRACVRVHGRLYTKRFPPDATLTDMKDWRAATRTDVLRQERTRPPSGTFEDDIETYLAAVKAMPTADRREADLKLWLTVIDGTRARQTITGAEIRAALHHWRLLGRRDGKALSESSCNHRRTALMHFFSVLNGKSGANPVRDVPKFREPDPQPRGLTPAQLETLFKAMPDSATKARAMVMAYTGLPPSTLARLTPAALNRRAKALTVPRRRKGHGTKTRTLPLSPAALKAFTALTKHRAWGAFSRDALRHSVQRACAKAGVPVIRAYDLRHSFGSAVYRASGDIRAVQALLDHSDVALTERYTLSAVDARMKAALKATRW